MIMTKAAAMAGKMTNAKIPSVVMLGVVGVVGRCERVNALDEFHPLGEAVTRLHEANDGRLADPPLDHLLAINEANQPVGGSGFGD